MVAELSSSTAAKLLVVAAAWFMSRDIRAEDLVPAWDGDLAKADDYQIDVTAYVRGTRRDERYVCGPRLWRKLQGRAKQAAKDVDWDELERDGGAQYLIKHIRKKLGAQPIQDAGKYLAQWIFNLRREQSEPMPSYISRDDEAYFDVCRGFDTEYFRAQRARALSDQAKEWHRLYQEIQGMLTKMSHCDDEGFVLDPADATAARQVLQDLAAFTTSEHADEAGLPDFGGSQSRGIPLDQLRGWLLLMRARLAPTERAAIISAVKGNFDYQNISEQLRVAWPDEELSLRDKKQGRDRPRGQIHAGWDDSPGATSPDPPSSYVSEGYESFDDPADDEDYPDDEPAEPLYSAEEVEQAEKAFATQQRSFEEARDLLRRVKTARRFYPVDEGRRSKGSGKRNSYRRGGSKGARPSSTTSSRRHSPAPSTSSRRTGASGKGQGGRGRTHDGHKERTSSRGPCLRCGGRHDTKECKRSRTDRDRDDRGGSRRGFGGFSFFGDAFNDLDTEIKLLRRSTALEAQIAALEEPVDVNATGQVLADVNATGPAVSPSTATAAVRKEAILHDMRHRGQPLRRMSAGDKNHCERLLGQPSAGPETTDGMIFSGYHGYEEICDFDFMTVLESASAGLGILDIGATSSICGIDGADAMVQTLKSLGKRVRMDVTEKHTFIFGNGRRMTCTGRLTIPATIGGIEGDLTINVLDAQAPMLVGVDVLTRLGAVIDCQAATIKFKKLGKTIPLVRLESGHLAMPLLPSGHHGFAVE